MLSYNYFKYLNTLAAWNWLLSYHYYFVLDCPFVQFKSMNKLETMEYGQIFLMLHLNLEVNHHNISYVDMQWNNEDGPKVYGIAVVDKGGIEEERDIDAIGAIISSGLKLQLSKQYTVDMMTGINKEKYFLIQEVVKQETGDNSNAQETNM